VRIRSSRLVSIAIAAASMLALTMFGLGQAPAPAAGQQPAAQQGGRGGGRGQGGAAPAAQGAPAAGAPAAAAGAPAAGGGRGGRGGGRGNATPAGPTPRWPDGKPNLGVVPGQKPGRWGGGPTTLPQGMLDQVPFQPWARAAYDQRQIDQFEPHTRCKASGVSRQFSTPYGTEFVEVKELQRMYIFDNGGPMSYRIIYMDGRAHPPNLTPTNYGHSIGKWEGDTLVVETVGLNEKFWLDTRGTPHTAQLKFTERFTRTDANTLQYQVTIDDPGAYTKPWTTPVFNKGWTANVDMFEYICQDANQGPSLMVGSQESIDNTKFFVP
jgi:hypothetical protein